MTLHIREVQEDPGGWRSCVYFHTAVFPIVFIQTVVTFIHLHFASEGAVPIVFQNSHFTAGLCLSL
jgi:hypothetical protein